MPQRRIPLLLICACALIFPASITRSELTGADPWDTFTVSITNDFPIRLSQRIHILPVPRGREIFYCLDAFRAMESESVAVWTRKNEWMRKVSLDPFENFRATVIPKPYVYECSVDSK
jgi:hypothetical protein